MSGRALCNTALKHLSSGFCTLLVDCSQENDGSSTEGAPEGRSLKTSLRVEAGRSSDAGAPRSACVNAVDTPAPNRL